MLRHPSVPERPVTSPETVRVGRFEWERLMLASDLSFATKSILLTLGIFMGSDGGNCRPGRDNLMQITERGKTTLYTSIKAAIDAGYLIEVERGGFRKIGNRASEYAAAVPKVIFDQRAEVIASMFGRRRDARTFSEPNLGDPEAADEGSADRTLVNHEGSASRTFVSHEGSVSAHEGSVSGHEGSASRTPPSTYTNHRHQPRMINDELSPAESTPGEGDDRSQNPNPDDAYVAEILKHRPDWSSRRIFEAVQRAVKDGRDEQQARRALASLAVGKYGETQVPGRLLGDGPWWMDAAFPPRAVADDRCPRHPNRRAAACGLCLREKPECPHGQAGGAEVASTTGLPRCPFCRRAALRLAEAA
jgi:hypothetical protein